SPDVLLPAAAGLLYRLLYLRAPLYQALRKGGPMHTVLKVLTMALALQGCSALCTTFTWP
ncbi:unnamed protein product, partial [Tetraodon nigroviridis]